MPETTRSAKVVRTRALTPHVRELVLQLRGPRLNFSPGQWVSLKLPIGERPPLNRAYSMAEPEEVSGKLTLAYDVVPGGRGSNYLANLRADDDLVLSGPHGNFTLPDPPIPELLFVARYTGIVPLRCMLRYLVNHDDAPNVTLIFSASMEEELVYHDELRSLALSQPRIRYVPRVAPPDEHESAADEVTAIGELVKALMRSRVDYVPMICGIKSFVRPLRTLFMNQGFARRAVKVETYD